MRKSIRKIRGIGVVFIFSLITIFHILGPIIQVVAVNIIAFMFVACIVGMPIFLINELINTINEQVSMYLILVLSSIVFTFMGKKLVDYLHKLFVHETYQKIITNSFNQKNIRLTVYILYFIILVVSNTFINNSLSKITLQAFATYIAFERIVTNWINLNLKSYISKSINEFYGSEK